MGFPGGSDSKVSAYSAGDPASSPGSGRSGEGNGNPLQYSGPHPQKSGSKKYFREGSGNPLQYSCLENSMDGGA